MFMIKIAQVWLVTFLASIAFTTFAIAAEPKKSDGQFGAGDLVEFTTGMGPMLGEIINGPDASNYYGVLVPSKGEKPINVAKLRLIQSAGAPNAAIAVGTAVSWSDGGVTEKGNVVKVNGNWCQVKTPSATTIGWVECKSLRVAGQANAPATQKKPESANGAAAQPIAIQLQGNWENADGTVKLEFQKANKCYISFGPMTGPCTYKQNPSGVDVNFDGEALQLAANDDGSLSSVSDPDAMMPIRLKKK